MHFDQKYGPGYFRELLSKLANITEGRVDTRVNHRQKHLKNSFIQATCRAWGEKTSPTDKPEDKKHGWIVSNHSSFCSRSLFLYPQTTWTFFFVIAYMA